VTQRYTKNVKVTPKIIYIFRIAKMGYKMLNYVLIGIFLWVLRKKI